jgi:hypothetical protein
MYFMSALELPAPSQPTSTAYAVANTQSQRFHCIYGVAAIFNCHTFCGYAPHAFGTLPVPLRYTAKEPSQPKHSNKKTLHSNHHHRFAYASIKIGGSILKHNAVLCVRFAQPPIAYASIPPQWLSHKSPLC